MGRAINMEKDLEQLKAQVNKMQEALDIILESINEEEDDGKKKANNEGTSDSNRKSNSRKSVSKKKAS
jgi:hypothetical protein|tara:strand:- start:156 stop:359 length:204 start_codon:yes stop_codon:yes gene_type:complete